MKKITIILLLLFVVLCKEETNGKQARSPKSPKQNIEIKAVSLFIVGKVESGTRTIKRGEVVSLENGLKTGNNSLIDVQILGNKMNPVIRLQANTIFKMKAIPNGEETLFKGQLDKGTVLVNLEKLNKNSHFVINTPTLAAEFRGTKVMVTVQEDGSTNAKLTEGSLAIKMNIPVIDTISEVLPDEELSKQLNKELKEVEVVLEPGQEVVISKEDTVKVLKEKKLDSFVNSPEINAVVNSADGDEDKISLAIDEFKNKKSDHSAPEVDDSKPRIRESIKILGLREKEKVTKELNELKGIRGGKVEAVDETAAKTEADTYLKEHRSEMVDRIEISLGKKSEGITLKNGRTLNGVIFQLHDQLKIITPEGEMVVPTNEVKSFAF